MGKLCLSECDQADAMPEHGQGIGNVRRGLAGSGSHHSVMGNRGQGTEGRGNGTVAGYRSGGIAAAGKSPIAAGYGKELVAGQCGDQEADG